MKKLVLKYLGNDIYFKKFEENSNFKMIKLDKFNQDLHNVGIFEEVVNIICNDQGFLEHIFIGKEKVKGQVEIRMNKSFKRLYCECSKEGKIKLNELILKNLNFSEYFNAIELDDTGLYDSFRVDELLKNQKNDAIDEIEKYAFKRQKGNQLYIISFFAQKKIEEPGFLEELEKNYGVYLDVDNFIKDMKKKLEEIKTYKEFYAFIGTDFGKDKTNKELIIEAYGKAKEKGYIRNINLSLSNSNNIQSIIRRPSLNRENITNTRYRNNRYNAEISYSNSNSNDSRSRSISRSISRNSSISRSRSRNRNRSISRSSSISRSRSRRNRYRYRTYRNDYNWERNRNNRYIRYNRYH